MKDSLPGYFWQLPNQSYFVYGKSYLHHLSITDHVGLRKMLIFEIQGGGQMSYSQEHRLSQSNRAAACSRQFGIYTVGHKKRDKYWPIFVIFFTAIYNNELLLR